MTHRFLRRGSIRITTFVCSETEVKVIDPNKPQIIEAVDAASRNRAFEVDCIAVNQVATTLRVYPEHRIRHDSTLRQG